MQLELSMMWMCVLAVQEAEQQLSKLSTAEAN